MRKNRVPCEIAEVAMQLSLISFVANSSNSETIRIARNRSGRAAQLDDRQMFPALDVAHYKSDLVTAGTTTPRPMRPFRSWFEPSPVVCIRSRSPCSSSRRIQFVSVWSSMRKIRAVYVKSHCVSKTRVEKR